jgi:hypothetical protein
MRKLWWIIMAGAILAGVVPGAEKVVNFSGTWVRDTAHSDSWQSPHNSGITDVIPRITGGHPGEVTPDVGWPGGGNRNDAGNPGGSEGNDDDGSLGELAGEWMEGLTLLIVQTEGELQTTRQLFAIDGNRKTVTQKFALDGSRCINLASDGQSEFESRISWKDDKLVNSGTRTIVTRQPRTEISVTEEYSISKDGKKLTIKTKSITPRGVTMIKQVFNKRGTPKS